jgi:ABC-type branched-subunit amino acid transport system substrate-binding protein
MRAPPGDEGTASLHAAAQRTNLVPPATFWCSASAQDFTLAPNIAQFPTAKVNTTKLAVTDTEVVVGQLHSATGTMAISETGSIQAEQLAIDQINAMGGVLGRKIKRDQGRRRQPTGRPSPRSRRSCW